MIKVLDSTHRVQLILEIYFKLAKLKEKITVSEVYKGTQQIWNLIKSCFGSGKWINNSPWSNSEVWKNN